MNFCASKHVLCGFERFVLKIEADSRCSVSTETSYLFKQNSPYFFSREKVRWAEPTSGIGYLADIARIFDAPDGPL